MATPINILIVEDSMDDALLLVDELKSAGFEPTWKRVETKADYLAALEDFPDLIISDYTLPQFGGLRAIDLLRERGLDIPFILVSGTVGEEKAVEAMKHGITDYLLKDRIERLGNAVERALDQKRLRAEHRRMQEQLALQATALESAANGIMITDRAGTILWVNPAFTTTTGYSAQEVIGQTPRVLKSGKHDERFYQDFWQTITGGKTWRGEFINRRKDGTHSCDEHTVTPVRSKAGKITHFVGILNDVTERKQAESRVAAFSSLGQKLNSAKTAQAAGEVIVEVADHLFGWDACTLDLYSPEKDRVYHVLSRDTINGGRVTAPAAYDDTAPSPRARRVIESGAQLILREEPYTLSDAIPFGDTARPSASLMFVPIRDSAKVIGILSIQSYKPKAYAARDLEALQALADHCSSALHRIQAAADLREGEERYRALVEQARDAVFTLAPDQTITSLNKAFETITGWPCAAWIGRVFPPLVHPDDLPRAVDLFQRVTRNEKLPQFELRLRTKAGGFVTLEFTATPQLHAGNASGVMGIGRDITERKQLEAQFRQAQKMEAIGQLAAGVAHDFNNMLAVIHGNAEMALMFANHSGHDARECVNQVIAASERAAGLTRQLLAFGRKQVMQSQSLDLNEVIGNLTKMLNRIIGENIKLQCIYATRLPVIQADVGMMEQVILNLVVNARDAMPQGGQLLLKTELLKVDEAYTHLHPEARAGEFICMNVGDTGTGIAPDHLPRIFEPFYTTKEVGKGTGLGLATVYGIVKQHQGWIEVTTELGAGTTFRIFLPAIPSPATEAAAAPAPALRGGTETILLVEDDPGVRSLTRRALEAFDYRVVEAASGREALGRWQSRAAEIDLLLTDMVMPDGVTGRELAAALNVESPRLKTIFMSGYSIDMAGEGTDFIRRTKGYFLQKPFGTSVLIHTVRQCLDER